MITRARLEVILFGHHEAIGAITGVSGSTAVQVDGPPEITASASATPQPITGKTAAVSVTATSFFGESALLYDWSATGPGPVLFGPDGTNTAKNSTATFSAAGQYVLTVAVLDGTGRQTTSSVAVTVEQTPASLQVSPATATDVCLDVLGAVDSTPKTRGDTGRSSSTPTTAGWRAVSARSAVTREVGHAIGPFDTPVAFEARGIARSA